MGISTTATFLILLFTCSTAAIAFLSVFANIIGHETQLHDLRNKVKDLHFKHLLYLAKQDGRIPDEPHTPPPAIISQALPANDSPSEQQLGQPTPESLQAPSVSSELNPQSAQAA